MNQNIHDCIQACLDCLDACNTCFDQCLQEDDVNMMAGCIRLDRECADICTLAVQSMQRNSPFMAEICALCADICEACGNECKQHNHDHCQKCAEACFACAEACRKMAA